MPRLPQYISQAQPQGVVHGVMPDAPRVGGLVAGVTNAYQFVQRGADIREEQIARLQAQQEHEAKQLAEEEAKAAISKTISDGRALWTENIVNAQQSASDVSGFTVKTLKDFDTWAEQATAATPELGRKFLTQRLQDLRLHVHEKAFEFEASTRRAKVVSDFSAGLDADQRTVIADPSQFSAILGSRLAAANNLTLDPQAKDKLLEHTREVLSFSAASGIVDRNPDAFLAMTGISGGKTGKDGKPLPADAEKAAAAVSGNPLLSSLKPAALQQLTERATMLSISRKAQAEAQADRLAASALAEQTHRLNVAEAAFNSADALANKGTLSPEYTDRVIKATAGTPYQAAFQALINQQKQNGPLARAPVAEQQATLDAVNARIAKNGITPESEKHRAQIESVFNATQSAIKTDPIQAAADRGVVVIQPLDTSRGILPALDQIAVRAQQAARVRDWAGKDVSPFTAAEAQEVAKTLSTLPPDQFGNQVAALAGKVPPSQLQAFARQVSPHDNNLALALAAGSDMTSLGRTTAEVMRKGSAVMAEKRDKLEAKGDQTLQQLRAEIYKYLGDSVSGPAREQVAEAATLLHFGLDASGSKSGAERAVRLAVGGDIVQHNGHDLPVSAGVTVDVLRDRLQRYPRESLAKQVPDGMVYSTAGGPRPMAAFMASLPDARLEPAGKGAYFVRSGSGLALNKDGQPIIIEVR